MERVEGAAWNTQQYHQATADYRARHEGVEMKDLRGETHQTKPDSYAPKKHDCVVL